MGRGGEGTICLVEGDGSRVAKLYASAVDEVRARKLQAMTSAVTPALESVAAWPSDVLRAPSGDVWGFVMPRVQAKADIHELYSPRSRSESFPQADFRLLAAVAANIARAFKEVHQHGHIIGDVNHGNVLVGPEGGVVLIDCDSFQVTSGDEVFTCDVGVPLFTPPELQGLALRGLRRTANHDRFGLAVLVFHLLYMGRHPYAGRYQGPEEMSIERAITEYRFAYGRDRASKAMQRPPGSLALETMGPGIADLFSAAFSTAGAQRGRPEAAAWVDELESLCEGLVACERSTDHWYPRALAVCPWCAVEIKTGAVLFGKRWSGHRYRPVVDLATLLAEIARVPGPGPDPPLPPERTRLPARVGFSVRSRMHDRKSRAGAVGRHSPEASVDAVRAEWMRAMTLWNDEASAAVFDDKRRSLESAVAELDTLPGERVKRLRQLDKEHRVRQLRRYLNRFPIERATIDGIGPSRTSMLASYGIETAADVTRRKILAIPGFDSALAGQLLRWRREHERAFEYDPTAPTDRRDIEEIDRELGLRQDELMGTVANGPDLLRVVSAEVAAAREALMPQLEATWAGYLRALSGQ